MDVIVTLHDENTFIVKQSSETLTLGCILIMFNKVAVDLWAGCGLQTSAQARVTHYMLPGTLGSGQWTPSPPITPRD